MPAPLTYSRLQIALHWIIVLLVAFQILFHGGIEEIWRARMSGAVANVPSPNPHVIVGLLIFALAIWRLALRLRLGVPALPESEHAALRLVAAATHGLFYILLIGMPISGAVAWFAGIPQPAVAHAFAEKILLALIALHVVAALVQHFWFRTNVLKRMIGMS